MEALATKPSNLSYSLIPVWQKERADFHKLSSDLRTCSVQFKSVKTHIHN